MTPSRRRIEAQLVSHQPPGEHVLVVEDDDQVRSLVAYLLTQAGHRVMQASSGEEALDLLAMVSPDLILLDVHLPGRGGLDVLTQVRANEQTRLTPVVMVTGAATRLEKLEAIASGVTDFIMKPFDPEELVTRVRALVRLKRQTDDLECATAVVIALARSLDARDPYTAGHSERVSRLGATLAARIGLSDEMVGVVRQGCLFHDLGKVAIRDCVLHKPGPLTPLEFEEIKRHTVVGRDLIAHMKTLAPALPVVLHHHERFDGSGYPHGLAGEEIPLIARITTVADVYDALTTARPYRAPFECGEALAILRAETERGWWDPELIAEFAEMMSEGAQESLGLVG